jgi:hypothetical protein
MSSIVIGGIALDLVSFREGETEWRGTADRAFDNTLLDGRDAPKRSWEGVTDWLATAAADSLRAAIASGPVSCSGVVLGETVTASVDVRSAERGPDVSSGTPNWSAINVTLALTLREA